MSNGSVKLRLRRNNSLLWMLYKRLLKLFVKIMPGYQLRRVLLRAAGYRVGRDVYIGEDLIIIDNLHEIGYLYIGDRVDIADAPPLNLSVALVFIQQ